MIKERRLEELENERLKNSYGVKGGNKAHSPYREGKSKFLVEMKEREAIKR